MAIRQEAAGRVLVVTIDNPAVRNAFDKATVAELRGIFEALAFRDPLPPEPDTAGAGEPLDVGPGGRYRPHAVVLAASGQVFCAGAHLGEMKELGAADYQENMTAALDMGAMFRAVRGCPVPVVARVQGPAYGGGVGLVAACDIVVAAPGAKFCFSEVKLGLVPGVISPLVMARIGQAAARRHMLTADVFGIEEASRIGLVDVAAGPDGLDEAVSGVVRALLAAGPQALGFCKALLDGVDAMGYAKSAEFSARMIAEARTKPEAQAALRNFLAKDPAPWAGDGTWTLPPQPDEVDG